NYRTSDKTKVLRKIFDAKVNLLHTIEEAKLIFESLKEQHDFDKLYETLDNLQDTSDKESGCPNTPQQCTKILSTNVNNCNNCIERQIPCKYKQHKKRGPKPRYKLDLNYHQQYIQQVEKKAQQIIDKEQQKLFKEYLEQLKKEKQLIPQQIYLFKLEIIFIINTIIESKHPNDIIEEKDIERIINFKRETISLYQFYEIQFHPYIKQILYQVGQCLTYNNLKELIEILTNDNQQPEEKNILTFEQQIEQLNQTKE
ncbi:9613_t:CDS:2, partial [Racocetra persica]